MAYKLDKGTETLKKTIKGKITHPYYKRVNEIMDQYTKYVTGEDVGSLLRQFNPREEDTQFKQRKELTQAVTSDMANRILSPMYKIGRSRADVLINWKSTEGIDKENRIN